MATTAAARRSRHRALPHLGLSVNIGYGYPVLVFLVLAGTTNGVNLTDGLDGLAAGCAAIVLLAYTAMTFITNGQHDLALVCSCLVGACVGFLWFNSFPAGIFMGDTGSLGFGGAIAALAVMTKTEVLLLITGGIFVIEALSVLIQVIAFQRFRKRVFLMAPVHHHFELMAWSETKIILRFWIVAAICRGHRLHAVPAVDHVKPRPPLPPGPYLVVGLARSGAAAARMLAGARGGAAAATPASRPARAGSRAWTSACARTGSTCWAGAHRREEPGRAAGGAGDRRGTRAGARGGGRARAGLAPAAERVHRGDRHQRQDHHGGAARRNPPRGGRAGGGGRQRGHGAGSLVGRVEPAATVVCETSSFQLEDASAFAPECAVLLNVSEDHLDRHGSFEAYLAAKLRIFEHQGEDDLAVLPAGFAFEPAHARVLRFGEPGSVRDAGRARSCACAAPTTSRTRWRRPRRRSRRGIDPEAVRSALRTFPGVAHRLEEVAVHGGVTLRQRLEGHQRGVARWWASRRSTAAST